MTVFPCPHNHLGSSQLLLFIGEKIGPEGESKVVRVTRLHSFEEDLFLAI